MSVQTPPSHVRVKRKRDDDPIDSLYIQHEDKKSKSGHSSVVAYRRVPGSNPSPLQFTLSDLPPGVYKSPTTQSPTAPPQPSAVATTPIKTPQVPGARRIFKLDRAVSLPTSLKRKNAASNHDAYPTFVEQRSAQSPSAKKIHTNDGKALAVASKPTASESESETEPILVPAPTADSTAPGFAGQPMPIRKKGPYPQKDRIPRAQRPPSPDAQSKEHMFKFAREMSVLEGAAGLAGDEGKDVVMADADYLFDVYELVTQASASNGGEDQAIDLAAGFVSFSKDEEEIWAKYLDSGPGEDSEGESDSDDENREDYYANDYPDEEDEDSEDENDPYKYRSKPADEEEFDLDDFSEPENEDEDEVEDDDTLSREWKTLKKKLGPLGHKTGVEVELEDGDESE